MSTPRKYLIKYYPEIAKEYDASKNSRSIESIGCGTKGAFFWLCSLGHSYKMSTSQRIRGQGCPFCSGQKVLEGFNDLATTDPISKEIWDYEKNEFLPTQVTRGTHREAYWKCNKGHSYRQPINKKVRNINSCPVCSGHKIIAGVNDLATVFPEIAKQWNYERNGSSLPNQFSSRNGARVWWKCDFGHEWEATIKDRTTDNTGCPICSARMQTSFQEQAIYYYIKKLYPDTINRYKDIFDNGMEIDIYVPSIRFGVEFDGGFWHKSTDSYRREKLKYDTCKKNNITLIRVVQDGKEEKRDISDATYYIKKKSHYDPDFESVVQAILNSIDRKTNMWTRKNPLAFESKIKVDLRRDENEIRASYLFAIKDSLRDLYPELAEEWDYEKNGDLKPTMFLPSSKEYVWWKCKVCQHEWKIDISSRAGKRHSGCPECAKIKQGKTFTGKRVKERGSLAENNPDLAKQWHPTKNGDLTPNDITEKRFKPVWWLCPKCGHEWQSSPNNRAKGSGCPCCSGRVPKAGVNDLKTLYPELVKEWDYEVNGERLPEMFLPKSSRKVAWVCSKCGRKWEATIGSRVAGHGCRSCSKTTRTK